MLKRYCSLLLSLLFVGSFLSAQSTEKRSLADLPFYIDVDAGAFIAFDYSASGYAHFAAGAGYRIHPRHAVGLEYRGAEFSSSGYRESGRGLGAAYRFTYNNLLVKASVGLLFAGEKNNYETWDKFERAGGGQYRNLTLAYRFRWGGMLGISVARFYDRDFTSSRLELYPEFEDDYLFAIYNIDDTPAEIGTFQPRDPVTTNFGTLTLTIGYAFPGRGSRDSSHGLSRSAPN